MVASVYQWLRFIEENYKDDIAFQYYRNAEVHQIRYAEFVNDIKRFVCYLQKHEEMVEGKHFGILNGNVCCGIRGFSVRCSHRCIESSKW